MKSRPLLACLAGFCLLQAQGAGAQVPEADPGEQPDTAAQLAELRRALAVRDQAIRNLIQRVQELELAVNELGVRALLPAAPPAPPAGQSAAGQPAASAEAVDQQLINAAFERTLIERGGLLLPFGRFEIEPSLGYAHSSSENLVIDGFTIFPVLVVGDIYSERRRRNTYMTTLTARFGLPWKSQLELRLPFIYGDDNRLTGDGRELRVSDHGIGDLEIALSRDLPRLFGRGPMLLGALRWKLTTARDPFGLDPEQQLPFGSGFQSLTGSLTGVSVVDPVVFFGTLSFTQTFAARKGDNRIEPGKSAGLQMGMALSLNLETSMSMAFEQSFTRRTRLNGAALAGTYVSNGTFSIGVSRVFPGGRSFDTSVAIGLSEDSPDLQLGFSMPFRR